MRFRNLLQVILDADDGRLLRTNAFKNFLKKNANGIPGCIGDHTDNTPWKNPMARVIMSVLNTTQTYYIHPMKKLIIAGFAAALLSLTACHSDTERTTTTTQQQTTVPAPVTTTTTDTTTTKK